MDREEKTEEKNMIHKILRIAIRMASEHEKDIHGITSEGGKTETSEQTNEKH